MNFLPDVAKEHAGKCKS